ncbi:bifunctional glutamate N-acetyltransferase/amino-acid acetyltransferase ArgJ, partial [Chloroflexota bacterium]
MEKAKIQFISGGTVTSPAGFLAGAVHAGIKDKKDKLDLGALYSEAPCVTAGIFTNSKIVSAPVILCRERIKTGRSVAIVVNSGCSNSYTGEQGLADAAEMAQLFADGIGAVPEDVMMASTGVTGQLLPMDAIRDGIGKIALDQDGGHHLANAIMTTDTVPKEVAVSVKDDDNEFTIGGIAKGSGMIHPDMATMFCFLTTDAAVELGFLKLALKKAADVSLNMISVDGDTSPSDTVLLMANGLAGNNTITEGSPLAGAFQQALEEVCIYLAKKLARDGEGATRLIEVKVEGARNDVEAKMAAKVVIGSTLVKTAVYGGDPNWGRIIMALGHGGFDVKLEQIDLSIGEIEVLKAGKPLPFEEAGIIKIFKQEEVPISINLNSGTASATAWGCDLSEDYVVINSQYMT